VFRLLTLNRQHLQWLLLRLPAACSVSTQQHLQWLLLRPTSTPLLCRHSLVHQHQQRLLLVGLYLGVCCNCCTAAPRADQP
jgi:hypothetical protein